MDEMMLHDWPGNVRELENAIERALVIGKERKIRAEDLPFFCQQNLLLPANESLKEVEKTHISRVLDQNQWNIARCAKLLDIDRSTLYSKIRRYRLQKTN
jgi:transcriptional regulator of acetoin/glycerol metabolism